MNKILSSLLLTGLSIGAIAGSAIAQTANFSAPHKYTDADKTYIYIPGQTAGAAATGFTSAGAAKPRTLTLNNCGWGSFSKGTNPPSSITGANWPATTGTAPTCTKDAAPATTYTSSNAGPVGTTIDDGTKIWVRGGTTVGSATIQVTANRVITAKANACGFIRAAISSTNPFTEFVLGGTNYTVASLPTVMAPMICRKNGATSVIYVPAN